MQIKTKIFATIIGNILELYDFTVFAFFAPVISHLFFPRQNQSVALIATFSVFAVGYAARPIGGLVFGHIGDRWGRKPALIGSILVMSLATFFIGCLPTFSQIGIAATISLVVFRLLQGLAAGGEMSGTIVYVTEQAPVKRRGFYGSWATASAIGGVLLGSLVGTIIEQNISPASLQNWGWRIPFWSGIILGLVGLWMRSFLPESSSFLAETKSHKFKLPVITACKNYWRQVLQALGCNAVIATSFYIIFVWLPTFSHSMVTNNIALVVLLLLILAFGFLSDIIERKTLAIIGIGLLLITAYPGLLIVINGSIIWLVLLTQIIFAFALAPLEAVMPSTNSELFPASIRYSGLAIGLNFTTSFFSGTAPLICTLLIYYTNSKLAPAAYLLSIALISLPAYLLLPKRKIVKLDY